MPFSLMAMAEWLAQLGLTLTSPSRPFEQLGRREQDMGKALERLVQRQRADLEGQFQVTLGTLEQRQNAAVGRLDGQATQACAEIDGHVQQVVAELSQGSSATLPCC